jgi:hypothetical protein
MTVFSLLPQDMLQYEINRFLDPVSRMAWNEVLCSDERVFKKFPSDYALKHQILVSNKRYQAIARETNYFIDSIEVAHITGNTHKLLKLLTHFFNYFTDPQSAISISFTHGLKDTFLGMLDFWATGEMDLYDYMTLHQESEIRYQAKKAFDTVSAISYIRDISLKGHKSIYS